MGWVLRRRDDRTRRVSGYPAKAHRIYPPPTTVARVTSPAGDPPVVFVHGWGGSHEATWERSGIAQLVREEGRTVVGVDLLGHGSAPRPHDPAAYADLGARVVDAVTGAGPVDGVGFSLGALTLLDLAAEGRVVFRRLVVAGVGRNVLEHDPAASRRVAEAIDAGPAATSGGVDITLTAFANYAHQPGNDPTALAAVMRRERTALTAVDLARISCPVLVAIGDADFAGPADGLVAALPDARLTVLRRTDHFATPESFEFVDAMLRFLAA